MVNVSGSAFTERTTPKEKGRTHAGQTLDDLNLKDESSGNSHADNGNAWGHIPGSARLSWAGSGGGGNGTLGRSGSIDRRLHRAGLRGFNCSNTSMKCHQLLKCRKKRSHSQKQVFKTSLWHTQESATDFKSKERDLTWWWHGSRRGRCHLRSHGRAFGGVFGRVHGCRMRSILGGVHRGTRRSHFGSHHLTMGLNEHWSEEGNKAQSRHHGVLTGRDGHRESEILKSNKRRLIDESRMVNKCRKFNNHSVHEHCSSSWQQSDTLNLDLVVF